ncbi:MAG: CHAT domain-containing protein [Coleofasciculaceae cyanobacterium SM2_1_6]|nr:CHAT domain-containing protein [Coleofasciculaceae cyanobacterium SM2_1_6]
MAQRPMALAAHPPPHPPLTQNPVQPPAPSPSPRITVSQLTCDVSWCTLPPNLNVPSIISTNAESKLPVITRIPASFTDNSLLLLEEVYESEFREFAGIEGELETLDIRQSQDILDRVSRETNTKPALVYIFFGSPNDKIPGTRSVNSARSQLNRTPNATDTLEIFLVPPNGDLIRVSYPGLTRAQITETTQRFVSLVVNRSSGYLNSSQQVYKWLIEPLESELKTLGVDNLVFLMDAGLRSIPFAALHNGEKFLIEDYSIGLMPSFSLTDVNHRPLKESQVIGMGAVQFLNNTPLPGVSLELNNINQIWGGNIFLNENFTLNNLRQPRQTQQRIVHLATHSAFEPGDKSNSFIQLWGNERLTLDQIRQVNWDAPLVDLLVLSACQTALGDREAELGFAGLTVLSGVKSALASLWLVSDEGTLGLMTNFYAQLQETTTKAEALRQAQLAMLRGEVQLEGGNLVTPQGKFPLNEELKKLGDRSLRHPYFWSGFTMVGNPW